MSTRYVGGGGGLLGGTLRTVVHMLIAWNVIIFLIQVLAVQFRFAQASPYTTVWIPDLLALTPSAVLHGQLWQLVTYMFLHGDFWHVAFNMFMLWMFGTPLQDLWGPRRFLTYYMITGVGAGVVNALLSPSSAIGASGAVYGLLLAFAMTFPNRRILLLLFPYPIRAKYLVLILGAVEVLMMTFFSRDGIAHLAHLGGLLTGFLYLKNIPMRWFRGGGRRGGGRGGPRIYDIRKYQDSEDRDSKWS